MVEDPSYSPVATTRLGSLFANLTSSLWVNGRVSTCDQCAPPPTVRQTPPYSVAANTICGLTGFTENASTRPPNSGAVPGFDAAFALMSFTEAGAVNAPACGIETSVEVTTAGTNMPMSSRAAKPAWDRTRARLEIRKRMSSAFPRWVARHRPVPNTAFQDEPRVPVPGSR